MTDRNQTQTAATQEQLLARAITQVCSGDETFYNERLRRIESSERVGPHSRKNILYSDFALLNRQVFKVFIALGGTIEF